jgi:hypothetical protein
MSNMRGPILNHVTMIEKFSRWATKSTQTSLSHSGPPSQLLDNTKFDHTVADGYDLLDVFFWSPSRLKQ